MHLLQSLQVQCNCEWEAFALEFGCEELPQCSIRGQGQSKGQGRALGCSCAQVVLRGKLSDSMHGMGSGAPAGAVRVDEHTEAQTRAKSIGHHTLWSHGQCRTEDAKPVTGGTRNRARWLHCRDSRPEFALGPGHTQGPNPRGKPR